MPSLSRGNLWQIAGLVILVFGIIMVVSLIRGGAALPSGLSVDSLLALLGGTFAFLAVMIQIETDKKLHDQELERSRVETAQVLLSDINGIYFSVKSVEMLRSIDPDTVTPLPRFKTIASSWSAVFQANASTLGSLGRYATQAVSLFYGKAEHFLTLLREYEGSAERVYMGNDPFTQEVIARRCLVSLKPALEDLRLIMYLACRLLCSSARFPFDACEVPIAGEQDIAAKLEAEYPLLLRGIARI